MTTTAEVAPVKVGDFFYCSWGYDQTNVDFYKVVGVTPSGKSVRVQQWSSVRTSGSGSTDYVVPGEGPAMFSDWSNKTQEMEDVPFKPAPVRTKRLSVGGYFGAAFTVNSYSAAFKWDGTRQSCTAYGYGH